MILYSDKGANKRVAYNFEISQYFAKIRIQGHAPVCEETGYNSTTFPFHHPTTTTLPPHQGTAILWYYVITVYPLLFRRATMIFEGRGSGAQGGGYKGYERSLRTFL